MDSNNKPTILHPKQMEFLHVLFDSINVIINSDNSLNVRSDVYAIGDSNGMFHSSPSTFYDTIYGMITNKENTKAPTVKGLLNRILHSGGYRIIQAQNVICSVNVTMNGGLPSYEINWHT